MWSQASCIAVVRPILTTIFQGFYIGLPLLLSIEPLSGIIASMDIPHPLIIGAQMVLWLEIDSFSLSVFWRSSPVAVESGVT